MSLIVTKGSTFISAKVNGTSGIEYTVSNGTETVSNLLTGEDVVFDNLEPETSYNLTISRDYKLVKRIKVVGTNYPLSIAEVRAWTFDQNLVRNTGTASQSSTTNNGVASRALDLSNKLYWTGNSVTHTAGGSNNYWQWDIPNGLPITRVKFWGRKDCCQFRQNGAKFIVYDIDDNILAQRTLGSTTNAQELIVQV